MMATGQPARKVRVSLSGAELRGSRAAVTDDQGRFSFTALPAGRYNLTASRPGHLSVTYGQRTPGRAGTAIQLGDGQKFQADLRIPRGSVITGTILDENGEPAPQVSVRAVRVAMQNGERVQMSSNGVNTDDRGIYRVFGLMPGDYILCATPRNNTMNDGERARIELQALQQSLEAVIRSNEQAAAGIRDRIASLQQTVASTPEGEVEPGYAAVCYPGTIAAGSAGIITVGVGEERPVDIQLQLAPLARVEGTVLNPTGSALRDVQVRLAELTTFGQSMVSTPTARADSEGRFRLTGVPPGQYRLTARATYAPPRPAGTPEATLPGGRSGPVQQRLDAINLFASADIVVDGRNLQNVMLSLSQGVAVSGQIRFEGTTSQPADLTRLRVMMNPADGGPSGMPTMNGRVDASGRFTVPSVIPGRYRINASGAGGWFVESAMSGGQDALDVPIDIKGTQAVGNIVITFTDRQTELTGTAMDDKGPATDYSIVVFPVDQRFWTRNARRIQSSRPATDGRFTFRNLPPGDYLMAPALDLEAGILYDTAFLQQLSAAATRITLSAGEKKTQDVRVR